MEEMLEFIDDIESLKEKIQRFEQIIKEILSEIENCSKFVEHFLIKGQKCEYPSTSFHPLLEDCFRESITRICRENRDNRYVPKDVDPSSGKT